MVTFSSPCNLCFIYLIPTEIYCQETLFKAKQFVTLQIFNGVLQTFMLYVCKIVRVTNDIVERKQDQWQTTEIMQKTK